MKSRLHLEDPPFWNFKNDFGNVSQQYLGQAHKSAEEIQWIENSEEIDFPGIVRR
jgi:hypothetical protein